jgi:hypothetical protein
MEVTRPSASYVVVEYPHDSSVPQFVVGSGTGAAMVLRFGKVGILGAALLTGSDVRQFNCEWKDSE